MTLVVKGTYHAPAKGDGLVVKDFADNSYSVEYVIPAETGEATGLQKTNPLDAASTRAMADYESQVKMRDARMYGNSADAPTPSRPRVQARTRGMNPMAMDPAVMAKVMACGHDKACQDRLVTGMMSQQMAEGVNPTVSADLQAISNMCMNDKRQPMGSEGYEKCLDEEGRKRSPVKSRVVAEPEVPELPDRYLLFRVADLDRKFKGHTRIKESTTRSHGTGLGGWIEETRTRVGEGDADPKGLQPCANEQAAFDTKTNTFWMTGLRPAAIPLTTSGSNRETETHTKGMLELPSEIADWISSVLEGVPASGSKTETFGRLTATFTWSLAMQ